MDLVSIKKLEAPMASLIYSGFRLVETRAATNGMRIEKSPSRLCLVGVRPTFELNYQIGNS
ncbi:unnamed protein product [Citrullus colocynthis]|uniref:Uncharacterized protein n=1 Tax=Citrullus colocynthis TaxID=252529 RepID=A0ABP0YKN6_9ROSI